jgi:Pvc16 N-terminal domain
VASAYRTINAENAAETLALTRRQMPRERPPVITDAMLQDLDATLAALLAAELPVQNVAISFHAPDDQFPPSGVNLPALAFFLYDVREDLNLRDTQWEVDKQPNGTFTRTRSPVRVTCSYLITAWPSASTPDPSQDEHRLLGEVIKVLLGHRVIPANYLAGQLAGQEPPLPARIIADGHLQSLGELWQAMGGKPKAALHYAVTISVSVFDPVAAGPAVTAGVFTITQGADQAAATAPQAAATTSPSQTAGPQATSPASQPAP